MMLRLVLLLVALIHAGCVGYDTAGIKPTGTLPVGLLTSEQTHALKSAASLGEPSLVATAARMAWESPDDTVSLANYAGNLVPERHEEVASAVLQSVRR